MSLSIYFNRSRETIAHYLGEAIGCLTIDHRKFIKSVTHIKIDQSNPFYLPVPGRQGKCKKLSREALRLYEQKESLKIMQARAGYLNQGVFLSLGFFFFHNAISNWSLYYLIASGVTVWASLKMFKWIKDRYDLQITRANEQFNRVVKKLPEVNMPTQP